MTHDALSGAPLAPTLPCCGPYAVMLANRANPESTGPRDLAEVMDWIRHQTGRRRNWRGRTYLRELEVALRAFGHRWTTVGGDCRETLATLAGTFKGGVQYIVHVTGHTLTVRDGLAYDQYSAGVPMDRYWCRRKRVIRAKELHIPKGVDNSNKVVDTTITRPVKPDQTNKRRHHAMSDFQLETNVPIPAVVGLGSHIRASKYPVDEWVEGQSFVVPVPGTARTVTKKDGTTEDIDAAQDSERKARTVAANVYAIAKRRGQAITYRFDKANSTVRFWHMGEFKAKAKGDSAEAADETQEGSDEFDL